MRDYGKVFSTFWTGDTTRSLTDDGKLLALYLLTGPHTNIIGCFRLPDGYVAADLEWTPERVSKGFGELFQNGFATRDPAFGWIIVGKYLKWNPPENPNQAKAAVKLFSQIPDSSSVKPLMARALEKYAGQFSNTFKTLLKPFLNPSKTVSKPETGTEAGTETEIPPPPPRGGDCGEKHPQKPEKPKKPETNAPGPEPETPLRKTPDPGENAPTAGPESASPKQKPPPEPEKLRFGDAGNVRLALARASPAPPLSWEEKRAEETRRKFLAS
jgi:hypothetical protein